MRYILQHNNNSTMTTMKSTALLVLLATAIATTSADILTNTNDQEGRRHRLIKHRNSQRINLDNGEDTPINDNASRRSRRKLQQQWTMLQAHDTIDIVNDYKYNEDIIIGQQQRLKKRPPDRLIPPIIQNEERGNDVEVSSGFRNKRPPLSPKSIAPTSHLPSLYEQSSTMIDVQSIAIDQPGPSNIINPNKKLNNKFGEELSGKINSREYYTDNPLIDINLDKFINNKRDPPTSAPTSLPSTPVVAKDTIIITNGDVNKEEVTLQEEYIKSSSRGSHTTVQIKGNATGTIDIRSVSRGKGKESTIFTMNVKGLDTHCGNMEWDSNDSNWNGKSGKSSSIGKKKTTKSSKSSKSKSSKSSKSKSSKIGKCSKQYKWREWNESMSIWSFDDHWGCSKSSKSKSSKSKGSKAKGSKSKGAKSKSPKRSKDSNNDQGSCLCGQCTQDGECNFQGHGHAKPQILYLKVDPALCPGEVDSNKQCIGTKEHITISFKGKDECTYTISNDANIHGLYRIAKPAICQSNNGSKSNKKNGVGTNVYIDYIGDSSPDTSIHASCSVDIYEGMRIGDSQFILAGYCLEGDNEGVEGSCSFIDQPKCSGYDPEGEDPEEEEDDDWNGEWDDDAWTDDDNMWDETNWPTWSPSIWEWPTYSPSIWNWNDDTWGNWDDDNWHDTDWPTYSPSIWDDDGWWDDDKWIDDDDDEDNHDDDTFGHSNSPSKAPISKKTSDAPTSSPSCPHDMRRLSTGECTPVGTSEPTSNSPTPAFKSQTKYPTAGDGDDDGVDVPDTSSPTAIPQPPPTNDTQEPTPSPEEQSTPNPVWTFPKNPRPNSPPPTEIDNTNSPSKFPSTQTDSTKPPSTNSPIGDGVLSKTPTMNDEPSLQPTAEKTPSTKSPAGYEVLTRSPTSEPRPESSDSPTKDQSTSSPTPVTEEDSPSKSPSTSDTKLPSSDSPSTIEPTDNSQPTLQPIIGDSKSPSSDSMSPSSDDSKSPTLQPSKVKDSKSPTTKSPSKEEVLTSSPTGTSNETSPPTPKPILKPPPTVRSRPTSSPMQEDEESSAPTELMPSKQPTSTSSSPTPVQSSPSQSPVTKSPIGDGVLSSPPTLVSTSSKPTLPTQSSSPTVQPSSNESPSNSKSPSTSPIINGEPSRTPTMEPSEQPTIKTPRAATPQPTTSPSSEPTVVLATIPTDSPSLPNIPDSSSPTFAIPTSSPTCEDFKITAQDDFAITYKNTPVDIPVLNNDTSNADNSSLYVRKLHFTGQFGECIIVPSPASPAQTSRPTRTPNPSRYPTNPPYVSNSEGTMQPSFKPTDLPSSKPTTQQPTTLQPSPPPTRKIYSPDVRDRPTRAPIDDPLNDDQPLDNQVSDGDSRLIAYIANWEACPSAAQLEKYTHIVVAFAVTYTWKPTPLNACNTDCSLMPLPICLGETTTQVADWQALGKKVILSFGGAGMGGSWNGDVNRCWDYCFGKEDQLSTDLVSLVSNKGLDGVDIDYEYCYETGRHSRNCRLSRTGLYSDSAAQNFLEQMTIQLRKKMNALIPAKHYELSHAPMDSDLVPGSPYYEILKTHNEKLDFVMPQFYNGITRPVQDGFDGTGVRLTSTSEVYNSIANDLFPGQPTKVVFGFCISDCGGTSSNANSNQAVTVLQQVKAYNNGEFACNGGAFFWLASDDTDWSNSVSSEISKTTGCSNESPASNRRILASHSSGGLVEYTPDINFHGQDACVYEVCDANDFRVQCDIAMITITVLSINGVVAIDDYESTDKNTPVEVYPLNNDKGAVDHPLETMNVTSTDKSIGECVLVNNVTTLYIPKPDWVGVDECEYMMCDDRDKCDDAKIYITVLGEPSGPCDDDELQPTGIPTRKPVEEILTKSPTTSPIGNGVLSLPPSSEPTNSPTNNNRNLPTTNQPTKSQLPFSVPSSKPSLSSLPSSSSVPSASSEPTKLPTSSPTISFNQDSTPTTEAPTQIPSLNPVIRIPTSEPTKKRTLSPVTPFPISQAPTESYEPSEQPTESSNPTTTKTELPSISTIPSQSPSMYTSSSPSTSSQPSFYSSKPSISSAPTSSGNPTTTKTQLPSISTIPSQSPSMYTSNSPSSSSQPSRNPSELPSISSAPSISPTDLPSTEPSTTSSPSLSGSMYPSISSIPTLEPSSQSPTQSPSLNPSAGHTENPSVSSRPSNLQSSEPSSSNMPTISNMPSVSQSNTPSLSSEPTPTRPSQHPSANPTISSEPSNLKSLEPSSSYMPTVSDKPSISNSLEPSTSNNPTTSQPSLHPTGHPTFSFGPSTSLSLAPSSSNMPTVSIEPSTSHSVAPSISNRPTSAPTTTISSNPSQAPSDLPSNNPTAVPTPRPVRTPEPTTPPPTVQTLKPSSSISPSTSPITPIPTPRPTYVRRDPINDGDFSDQGAQFDPTSTLTSYTSAGCGPRGHDADANLNQCPYGSELVKESDPAIQAPQISAIINGCQYFTFKVYECLPQRRSLLNLLNDREDSRDTSLDFSKFDLPMFNFDPHSTLAGYIAKNDCGPRGSSALADLSQCRFGHESIQYVPWNDDKVVAQVDRCDYVSYEVYECLPRPETSEVKVLDAMESIKGQIVGPKISRPSMSKRPLTKISITNNIDQVITQYQQQTITSTTPRDNMLPSEVGSCKVVVGQGSCAEPTSAELILGKTSEDEFVIQGMSFDQFSGKVLMVNDYQGNMIGCGEIEDEPDVLPDASGCLCGCTTESCTNRNNKPYSLILKLEDGTNIPQITVYFKPKKHQDSCSATVDVDTKGLYHIALPDHCKDDDGKGIGNEVAIDYKGDERVDVELHTSCSVPLYIGMPIEDSPFIISGYCLNEDESSCIESGDQGICSF